MNNIQDNIEVKVEKSPVFCMQDGYQDTSNLKASLSTFAFIDSSEVDDSIIRTAELRSNFEYNYRYWLDQTGCLSANNYDNSYFRALVDLGTTIVPFILEKIEKEPNPVVHALDLIYPGVVEYRGYNSLENVCALWLEIFKQRLIVY